MTSVVVEFHASTVQRICDAISDGLLEQACSIARQEIPFEPISRVKRTYTETEAAQMFVRDGFVDRYSGKRLIYPPVLRLLSSIMPNEIPYHRNWKTTECHMLFWHLSPTVDHVLPVARGGLDESSNWVCTSMVLNAAKANWTLEELGWHLVPPGDFRKWDGMLKWFMDYVEHHRSVLQDSYFHRWHKAAQRVMVAT